MEKIISEIALNKDLMCGKENWLYTLLSSDVMVMSPGGILHKIFVSTCRTIGPNRIKGFMKMSVQKDFKSMKKGVNWIENQWENLYKML